MLSVLVNIFCIGLLWLSASTYQVTAPTTAAVVSHLEGFNSLLFGLVMFGLVMFGKQFFLVQGKKIAIV